MSSSIKPTPAKAKPKAAKTGAAGGTNSSTKPAGGATRTADKAAAKPPAKPAAAAQSAAPAVIDPPRPVIVGPLMRKKELIEAVVQRSGVKKKDAKPVIEAMLAVLGEALGDNRELILPPMGKFKVSTEKQLANGRVMRIKVRQSTPPAKSGLPDAAE